MAFDLSDATPIRTVSKFVEARCYNSARLSLKRLRNPCELELSALKVRVSLRRDQWLVYPLNLDFPLMAWVDFEVQKRALHEPVRCQVHLYHFQAGLLVGRMPAALESALRDQFTAGARTGYAVPWSGPRW